MEKVIIKKWNENKDKLKEYFSKTIQKEYCEYNDLFKKIMKYVLKDYYIEDWEEIGSYQGDIYFTIKDKEGKKYKGEVSYGSCSWCDSLISIHHYNCKELPSSKQLNEYMQLCLAIIESFKEIE